MAQEFERPRVTEIHVRMDCNGCVQKIKKALNGINGIYDLYIDFPQQKLTVIGKADPERIMKAIKKVRKVATICSHTEVPDPNSQPPQPMPDGGAPPPDGGAPPPEGGAPGQESGNSQPEQPQQSEAPPPPQEPPTDQPPPPQQPENPPPQCPQPEPPNPPPAPADMQPSQPPPHTSNPNHAEEVRVTYHNPHDYGRRYGYGNGYGPGYDQSYGGQGSSHPGPSFYESGYYERPRPVYHDSPYEYGYHDRHRPVYNDRPYHDPPPRQVYHEPPPRESYHEQPPPRAYYQEPPPLQVSHHEQPPQSVYATHSYNMYRPAPSITEYHHVHSPPRYAPHIRTDYYDMDSYQYGNTSNGNVSSIFSDENPNACTIV
ncbi:hypothetical protein RND81_14G136300 [Saponaria officinalis]|uniref:HMA domain-containing protein n=1 Tax=Saponaria officinalis TaxID=3572 RepID=A0AAW1GPX4_SAPOF